MQIGQLLSQRVPFCRDPADDPMSSAKLLRHRVQVPVEGAQSWVVAGRFHGNRGGLLLLACASHGSCTALAAVSHIDHRRAGVRPEFGWSVNGAGRGRGFRLGYVGLVRGPGARFPGTRTGFAAGSPANAAGLGAGVVWHSGTRGVLPLDRTTRNRGTEGAI